MCDEHESQQWVKEVDRSGLIHVSDDLYMVFLSMEMELRRHLKLGNDINIKDTALGEIMKNEDVLFYWSLVSVNWDETHSNELLQLIVQQWITVRGFSFVSGFMEMYKQRNQKSTQKTKGLRKTLIATSVDD